MALDQSALLELLESLKAADADDLVRRALQAVLQALIEAEATAVIGPHPTSAPNSARPGATGIATGC